MGREPPVKVPKTLRGVVRAAVDQGWLFTEGGKHAKLSKPDGSYAIPLPSTRVSKELQRNITMRLRKHGVEYDGK